MNQGAFDPTKFLLLVIYNFLMADFSSSFINPYEVCFSSQDQLKTKILQKDQELSLKYKV